MYKDAYPTNNGAVQISVVQIVVITLTLLVTFVIPAEAITYMRSQQAVPYTAQSLTSQSIYSGQVAGASTSSADNTIYLPVLNTSINLNSQTGMLMLGSLLLAGIAVIITLYLLLSMPRRQAKKAH